ncbi:MAG TPA: acyl-CoA carboxylase subunit epsilon [Actinomycetes bacterium]|nr:acyl-CoA carboxylase subunit epsilon [Actinomycetes bacterium]
MPEATDGRGARPALRVVRGEPTPEELAALVTVLAARAAMVPAAGSGSDAVRSAWQDRSRYLRTTLPHGAGAWRASAWAH